jgi:hypothetical protein
MRMSWLLAFISKQWRRREMATLQIRELGEEVYRALSERAREERRSLAQQAAITLERALLGSSGRRARRESLILEITEAGERAWPAGLPDAAALVREDRDR